MCMHQTPIQVQRYTVNERCITSMSTKSTFSHYLIRYCTKVPVEFKGMSAVNKGIERRVDFCRISKGSGRGVPFVLNGQVEHAFYSFHSGY